MVLVTDQSEKNMDARNQHLADFSTTIEPSTHERLAKALDAEMSVELAEYARMVDENIMTLDEVVEEYEWADEDFVFEQTEQPVNDRLDFVDVIAEMEKE